MSKKLLSIIWVEAVIAFSIPFLTALGVALAPYVPADSAQPSLVGWLVIIIAPLVAGMSALKSFLSTTVSDAKDSISSQSEPHTRIAAEPPAGPSQSFGAKSLAILLFVCVLCPAALFAQPFNIQWNGSRSDIGAGGYYAVSAKAYFGSALDVVDTNGACSLPDLSSFVEVDTNVIFAEKRPFSPTSVTAGKL